MTTLVQQETSKIVQDEELRPFSEIKNSIEDAIDRVVRKHFHGQNYQVKEIKHLVDLASEEIIKECQESVSTDYKFMSTLIAL